MRSAPEAPPYRFGSDPLRTTVVLACDCTPVDAGLTTEFAVPDVGAVLGRYRLVAWQGLGSTGVVFRGVHLGLDIPVAIKILYRDRYPDRLIAHAHLRTEAFLLARLNHANIVRLWDYHDEGEPPYLITEFVPGPTLGEVIRKLGRLEPRQAVQIVAQAAEALAEVWRFGAVHRDVKPENLILGSDGTVKLIDFGLSMLVGEEAFPVPTAAASEWAGTPAYLAPEQSRSDVLVDHRADIYSLGVTLYEALTGRLPFVARTAPQMILRHREQQPMPPAALRPAVSRELSDVVLRMLAKNPADRFQDIDKLRAALNYAATTV